ncbi:MAG: hypothetical protein HRU13_10565, partial [Phycisphaerales bacterium]|nr:hypothetical protein [Phycisphaerales bacterium]
MLIRAALAGCACVLSSFASVASAGDLNDALFARYFNHDHRNCGTPDPRLLPGVDSPSDCSLGR